MNICRGEELLEGRHSGSRIVVMFIATGGAVQAGAMRVAELVRVADEVEELCATGRRDRRRRESPRSTRGTLERGQGHLGLGRRRGRFDRSRTTNINMRLQRGSNAEFI